MVSTFGLLPYIVAHSHINDALLFLFHLLLRTVPRQKVAGSFYYHNSYSDNLVKDHGQRNHGISSKHPVLLSERRRSCFTLAASSVNLDLSMDNI